MLWGGTGALVNGLVALIKGQGGDIRYKADVAQILVEEGAAKGVQLASGEIIVADIVVWAAWEFWKIKTRRQRPRRGAERFGQDRAQARITRNAGAFGKGA